MFSGIRVTICREGWYYLFVVLFILGGAVLREVNLLVVLAGMMIGPMIFNWRFVRASVQDLAIARKFPSHIGSGEQVHIDVAISNRRKRVSCWTLILEDRVVLDHNKLKKQRTKVELLYTKIAAGETVVATYSCILHQRGRYRLGPAKASSRFPLGLVQATITLRDQEFIVVCPKIGYLTERWSQLIEADRVGSQKTHHRRGVTEGDYYGLREWRAGDSKRWIHWRTSARIGELAVRQFEQQRNQDVALLIDAWQPQNPTEEQLEAVELAISFAATAVVDLCRRGGSHLMTGVAGKEAKFWSAMTSSGLAQEVLEALATVQAGDGSHARPLLERTVQENRPGMKTIVISTRASGLDDFRRQDVNPIEDVLLSQATWIDVNDDTSKQLYRLHGPKSPV